jgi:hypothetical protein
LASWDEFSRKYQQRHRTIIKSPRSYGKSTLEAFFTFTPDMSKVLGGVPMEITFYTAYLQDLPVEYYSQRASALINRPVGLFA